MSYGPSRRPVNQITFADLVVCTKEDPMDKEMKLREMEPEAYAISSPQNRIFKILWAVDPAILRRLKDETVINIARIQLNHLAEVASSEAKALTEMAKVIGK